MKTSLLLKHCMRDPRYYQIAVLSSLLLFGLLILDFGIRWQNALAMVPTALFVQFLGTRLAKLPRFRHKHVFNPANFALVLLMLLSDRAWVSSGQWGSAAIGAFVLACLGFLVLTRARRAETSIVFLLSYGISLFGRALWLDDPISIPLHQLQNGALLIFAFFMISDPKTTPDAAFGRCVYATLVASVAYTLQFIYYQPNGPILALIMCAPLVPVIDALLHGPNYRWERSSPPASSKQQSIPFKGAF